MKTWVSLLIIIAFVAGQIWLSDRLYEPAKAFAAQFKVGAPEPANIVTACVKTATTGAIDYWYCTPDEGPSFVANSVGFVAIEQ